MIVQEQKAIKQALLDFADKNYLQLRDVQHASTEEVFYLINRYHQRVAILHYGGHADGQSLQMEREIGVVQTANVKGIAGLLGTQKQLKLVFLNGCASRGQVSALLDHDVQAVIATRVAIKDSEAQLFATQFYQALGTGSSIREAFQKAKALIETERGVSGIKTVEETRGIKLGGVSGDEEIPWGLYWKPDGEAVLDWTLPTESPLELDFGNGQLAGKRENAINNHLVDNTLRAIKDSLFVKELARKIIQERKAGDTNRKPTDAEKKDVIIRSYLAPVSVQLRSLFSQEMSERFDEERLRQLLVTYQRIMEMLSFILLSDIWDARHSRQAPLAMAEAERLQLQAFFDLNGFTAPAFDYFLLTNALLKIAQRNEIQLYLAPLQEAFPEGLSGHEVLDQAHEHFQFIKTVLEEDVPSRLIEPYCVVSEQQLTEVLCAFHFLIHFHLSVIKNIEVRQIKNMPPVSYKHLMVELDNNFSEIGQRDRWQDLETSTDMESVLLYRENLRESLNLSPFILDENALTREVNSKVYFFSHCTETALVYYWIENQADRLEISDRHFGYIKEQFAKARRDLLNEEVVESKSAEIGEEDDISMLL